MIVWGVIIGVVIVVCLVIAWLIRRYIKKIQAERKRFERLYETLIQTLARTIEAKDQYTKGHSQRVAKYSKEIAKRMGKGAQEQQNIYDVAMLHDVGKIRIPDTIINKPGRLTDEEYEYMKLHTMAGYYILRDIGENSLFALAAKSHHERFDGSGYPNGLEGADIPEIARIIGVADAYDAMTSNRSYRETMEQHRVREEIVKGRGRQFDPKIADIMLQMIDADKQYDMRQKKHCSWKIFAVDDEIINLKLLERMLQGEESYHLQMTTSGQEALDTVHTYQPDLILLDIEMPEMDGFELYEKIQQEYRVPVVFLTANKKLSSIKRATQIGVVDYLVKPFTQQALLEMLHSILNENNAE